MARIFFIIGSISGGIAVALGAFGAHGLSTVLSEDSLRTFETGARYQMFHALSLLATGLVVDRWGAGKLGSMAGWAFVAGTLLFSGSLYLYALTSRRVFAIITPLGGIALAIGWLLLAISVWKSTG